MTIQNLSKNNGAVVSARVPKTLKTLISKIVEIDGHMNESDFVRDAIREKIQRDAPELYKQLFCTHSESGVPS